MIQLSRTPANINIIQIHPPIADKPTQKLEESYEDLEKLITLTRINAINTILGAFNAKIDKGTTDRVCPNLRNGRYIFFKLPSRTRGAHRNIQKIKQSTSS